MWERLGHFPYSNEGYSRIATQVVSNEIAWNNYVVHEFTDTYVTRHIHNRGSLFCLWHTNFEQKKGDVFIWRNWALLHRPRPK